MKKIIKIMILLVAAIFLLVGCNNNTIAKREEMIKESMLMVQEIISTIKVHDKEVLVFQEIDELRFVDSNCEVSKTITTLGSDFSVETNESTEVINSFDRNQLYKLNMNEEMLTNIQFDNEGNLSCEVTCENFKNVFISGELEIVGNAKIEFKTLFATKNLLAFK